MFRRLNPLVTALMTSLKPEAQKLNERGGRDSDQGGSGDCDCQQVLPVVAAHEILMRRGIMPGPLINPGVRDSESRAQGRTALSIVAA